MCCLQINVYGANSDLHSGTYGGAVANPLHALVRVLDSMRSLEGKILVEGFFDDVVPLTETDRETMADVPFDEKKYFDNLGLEEGFGEPGYTTRERAWARPTLEINGLWGGFQGEGLKTVLPNQAHAKITCRLVPNQRPDRILQLLKRHIEQQGTPGVRVEVDLFHSRAEPYFVPIDHWGNRIVSAVLEELYGKTPYYVRSGGSVPVCEPFLTYLGADTVTLAFSLDDENVHAPNEFLRLASFERGQRAWVKVLQRLGTEAPDRK
jgi:acetylornithine deacetylase/succinyl-diaminopimelate desuccinylase-like protein